MKRSPRTPIICVIQINSQGKLELCQGAMTEHEYTRGVGWRAAVLRGLGSTFPNHQQEDDRAPNDR